MAKLAQSLTLRANNFGVPPVIHAVQGDTHRQLIITIEDYEIASGATAVCWFERPNGTVYSKTCTISASRVVTCNLNVAGGALTQAGRVLAQLVITESSENVSTFDFFIDVQASTGGTSTTEDVNWKNALASELNTIVAASIRTDGDQNFSVAQRVQALKNEGIFTVDVANGESVTLSFATNSRALMVINGNGSNNSIRGLYIVASNGTPNVHTPCTVLECSSATFTTSGRNLTIANSNAYTMSVSFITFGGKITTA